MHRVLTRPETPPERELRLELLRREQAMVLKRKLQQAHNERVRDCLQLWADNAPDRERDAA